MVICSPKITWSVLPKCGIMRVSIFAGLNVVKKSSITSLTHLTGIHSTSHADIHTHTHLYTFSLAGTVIKLSWWRPSARPRHLSQTSIQVWHTLARGALWDPTTVLHVSAETEATVSGCCSLHPSLPLKPSIHPSLRPVPGAAGQS